MRVMCILESARHSCASHGEVEPIMRGPDAPYARSHGFVRVRSGLRGGYGAVRSFAARTGVNGSVAEPRDRFFSCRIGELEIAP
jgi:hypothetical protein